MFEKLFKSWLKSKHLNQLNIKNILGENVEILDEDVLYYIEEIYLDDEDSLCGWCIDKDGGEFEKFNLSLPKEVELKIINWFTDNN